MEKTLMGEWGWGGGGGGGGGVGGGEDQVKDGQQTSTYLLSLSSFLNTTHNKAIFFV